MVFGPSPFAAAHKVNLTRREIHMAKTAVTPAPKPKPVPKLLVGSGAPYWDLGNPHQILYVPRAR